MVCPLQIGDVVVVAMGVTGGLGSDKVKGPMIFDGQPFSVTIILEYIPERRPDMVYVVTPASVLKVIGPTGLPLFKYVSEYPLVDGVNPDITISPVFDEQALGLVGVPVIAGLGLT
jgi:hypothetical protein